MARRAEDYGSKYSTARERLLLLLLDSQWHTRQELEAAAGNRYSARMLELRRTGWQIESENHGEHGKRYRMTGRTAPQEKRVKVFLREIDAESAATYRKLTDDAQAAIADALGSYKANRSKL